MYKLIIIISLGLSSSGLLAQDLIDIYQMALVQDAELKIAEAEFRAELESLPVASSALKPQIGLSAQGSTQEIDIAPITENTIDSTGYSINLVQSLYNAESLASVDAAEANVARARAELEVSRQDLILRVAERYFAILAAEDNVEFTIAEENAIARQLEQAQKRFEVGLIAITDVLEAQARFDSAVAQSLLAKNLLDNANQVLEVIIAQPPSAFLAKLGDRFALDLPEPANSQQWVELSLQNNQSLIAAQAAQKAANFETQARQWKPLSYCRSYRQLWRYQRRKRVSGRHGPGRSYIDDSTRCAVIYRWSNQCRTSAGRSQLPISAKRGPAAAKTNLGGNP